MQSIRGVLPLAIGSFPHQDPDLCVDLIRVFFPEILLWPQLPRRSFLENMYVQYSNPMPALRVDRENRRVFFDTDALTPEELEAFYARAMDEDLDYFGLPETHAAGFYALLASLERKGPPEDLCALKGHVTGPFSFGLTVTDQHRKAIIHHEELFEAVVSGLALNARWQVEKLKRFAPEVLVFVDEPYLVSFGSAFVSLDRDFVRRSMNELVRAIHQSGGVAGIHCCGNTDWSLVLETDLDVLSFDAYQFFDNVVLYADGLSRLLEAGGTLAWGIVPTSEQMLDETDQALLDRLISQMETLEHKGFDPHLVRERAFITPACGLESLSETLALEAIRKSRTLALGAASRLGATI